jgi:GH15 family glucan-1,4-alpha-glucosidase
MCLGIRLADKRSLPAPKRFQWLAARDALYEEIMAKAWNADRQFFGQSYDQGGLDILDSSVLIMPLVFFITPVSSMPYMLQSMWHDFFIHR